MDLPSTHGAIKKHLLEAIFSKLLKKKKKEKKKRNVNSSREIRGESEQVCTEQQNRLSCDALAQV